jgi:hypothetical protein
MTPKQMSDEYVARTHLDVPDDIVDSHGATTRPTTLQDVLKADPQLSAALLITRMELAAQNPEIVTNTNQAAMR